MRCEIHTSTVPVTVDHVQTRDHLTHTGLDMYKALAYSPLLYPGKSVDEKTEHPLKTPKSAPCPEREKAVRANCKKNVLVLNKQDKKK